MGEMDRIAEIMRLFTALPDDKKQLALEKARQLVKETERSAGQMEDAMAEPEITELQRLAHNLGDIFDEIRKLDEHKCLAVSAGWNDRQIREAENELWAQYHGILDYMQHCFPEDTKDLMILAGCIYLRHETTSNRDFVTDRDDQALERLIKRLVEGFEQQLGCSLVSLGFKGILTKHIDDNSMAVQICHDIMAAQMDEANKSGLANVIKAGVMHDVRHAKKTSKEPEDAAQ